MPLVLAILLFSLPLLGNFCDYTEFLTGELGFEGITTDVSESPRYKAGYLEVTDVETRGTGEGDPLGLAIYHPKLAEAFQEIRNSGHRLFINFTGRNPFHHSTDKVISISPESSWSTLQHEVSHMRDEVMQEEVGVRPLSNFAGLEITEDTPWRMRRAIELARLGHDHVPITETIATEFEGQLLRKAGLDDDHEEQRRAYKYGLKFRYKDKKRQFKKGLLKAPEELEYWEELKAEWYEYHWRPRMKMGSYAVLGGTLFTGIAYLIHSLLPEPTEEEKRERRRRRQEMEEILNDPRFRHRGPR